MLTTWIDNHCPEGEPEDAASPARFLPGWRIPNPDLVVPMTEEPHAVPAEGEVDYEYFLVDPGFTEDRYLHAAEGPSGQPGRRASRPGRARAARRYAHAVRYARRPARLRPRHAADDLAARDGPARSGRFEVPLPDALHAQRLSATGSQSARDEVFADSKTVTFAIRVEGAAVMNPSIAIPPGVADYRLSAEHVFPESVRLLSLSPHSGPARQVVPHRGSLSERPPRDSSSTCLATTFNWQLRLRLRRTQKISAARHAASRGLHRSVRQFQGQPSQPEFDPSRRLGRSNTG